MEYKIYKKEMSRANYFKGWAPEQLTSLTKELEEQIYKRYLIKCKVFTRDNFKCQNIECLKNGTSLTLHHVKFQKNGGKDSERNGVTLCKTCHQAYHRAKKPIVFADLKALPSHIRGHIFKLSKPDKINWKAVKAEMKGLRKNLKEHCGVRLSWNQIALLMKFLELELEE